jgi:hypothetical protein
MKWLLLIGILLLAAGNVHASASFRPGQFSPSTPTDAQMASCAPDAFKYCSHAIPDFEAVKRCMLFNRRHLAPECRDAFK